MPKPKFELLKEAYAIIGGIPSRALRLSAIKEKEGKSLSCGTVCCAAGWLGLHPKFRALGLETPKYTHGSTMLYKGKYADYDDAMAKVFNISASDAYVLFTSRHSYEDAERPGRGTDKQIWQQRVREFLREHGQLKSQLAKKSRK